MVPVCLIPVSPRRSGQSSVKKYKHSRKMDRSYGEGRS